jgi:hypothetical protein
MVGKIIYMVNTCFDISEVVSQVNKFIHQSNEYHQQVVKHIYRYIVGTLNYGITYSYHSPLSPACYSDADWPGCKDCCCSIGGYVLTMAEGPISWNSKKQTPILYLLQKLNIKPCLMVQRRQFRSAAYLMNFNFFLPINF